MMRHSLCLLIVLSVVWTGAKSAPGVAAPQKLASYQASGGFWHIGDHRLQCGGAEDIPVPADYFNENSKRVAVFRPSTGVWFIKGPGNADWGHSGGNFAIQCGINGDIPVPGEYEGEKKVSIAVWRPSNGYWYIKGQGRQNWDASSGDRAVRWGTTGDVPVPMDYFNEGRLRLAVWRPSNGVWYIKGREGGKNLGISKMNIALQCGVNGDVPVPGDYFGDGIVRLAVWRPSNGMWYIKGTDIADWGYSTGNVAVQCGVSGDIPVPFDFFGEGKLRIAVYRPSNGHWYIKGHGMNNWGSSTGNMVFYKGLRNQIPVNLF